MQLENDNARLIGMSEATTFALATLAGRMLTDRGWLNEFDLFLQQRANMIISDETD